MITLTVGASVKLSKGDLFTASEEQADIYVGYVTVIGLWGAMVTMKAFLFRASGQVFDTFSNNYYDTYETDLQLPFGLSTKVCDCGGFKTYNSMADHYHSRWCQVNKEDHGYKSLSRSC